MIIIKVIIKLKANTFLPLELELTQKCEIVKTAAINIAIGMINLIIIYGRFGLLC